MTSKTASDVDVLRKAYAAFNSRNIDAALAVMDAEVTWPKAFKGGFVRGHQEVRDYWTEQWSEIDPMVEPTEFILHDSGSILVHVHQVVKSLDGALLADQMVAHRFVLTEGFIKSMEVESLAD